MGIVHQLFVYSTFVFQKYNTFSYEMMIVFHKTLFWNVVVWRMIEMKHFSFFFNIKLSKRINWWKIYFSRGNNFHHFRKRRTQTWPKTIILSNIRIDILNTTCLPCHDVLAKSTHKQPVKENLLFTLKLNRRIFYGANQTE